MTDLSPALDAELANDRVTIFGALTLTVGGDTVRLLDGSAEIDMLGHTYSGEDPVYGSWAALDDFEDGTGDEAPGINVVLLPPTYSAALTLSGPQMQGETMQIHFGARNDATGQVIGDPFLLFDGEVDVTGYNFDARLLEIELEGVGGMERFFFNEEGIRLSPSFHAQVWPGEAGMNMITGVEYTIYWGGYEPSR